MLLKSQGGEHLFDIKRMIREIRAHFDILLHIQVRDQVVHLEYVAKVLPPVAGQLLFVHVLELVTVYADKTFIRRIYSAYNIKESRLART